LIEFVPYESPAATSASDAPIRRIKRRRQSTSTYNTIVYWHVNQPHLGDGTATVFFIIIIVFIVVITGSLPKALAIAH
jgi:hypothetical protein